MKRWFGIMLALVLTCTPMLEAFALAESATTSAPVEAESALAQSVGVAGLQVELEDGEVLDEVTSEPTDAPTITVQPTKAPAFEIGYVKPAGETAKVFETSEGDTVLATLDMNDAVLAIAEAGDRYEVVYCTDAGVVTGFVAAEEVVFLSDEEIQTLQSALVERGEAYLNAYNDDYNLLIPWLDIDGVAPVAPEAPEATLPTAITLNRQTLNLGLKESYSGLTASIQPASCTAPITWRSSNKKVVKVDAVSGVITGVKKGSATIYAEIEGGISASCKVTVKKAPSKVTVNPAALKLSAGGMTYALKPAVNSGAASAGFTYSTSNASVATVDALGVVRAVGAGTATITIKSYNKKKATCKVTVYAEPASVAFASETVLVAEAQTLKLEALALAEDGSATQADFTFAIDPESEDAECIELDPETGAVKGVRKGTALVKVAAHNGIESAKSCLVKVVEAPADIQLSASSVRVGEKETLSAPAYVLIPQDGAEDCAAVVTWRSGNAKVVKVNAATGAITGVKKGSATIYATTHNGKQASCKVTVGKAPSKVTLSSTKATLSEAGQTLQLAPVVNSGAASGFTYSTSNPEVAIVSADGLVTSVGPGTATITVKTYNNKKATCKVTVVEAPVQVTLPESLTLCENQTSTLKPTAIGKSGSATTASYTFAGENGTGAIEVDAETGAVTGLSTGTAYVRVTTHNGVSTHLKDGAEVETVCAVTVVDGPADVMFNATAATLGVGEYLSLRPIVLAKDGSEMAGDDLVALKKSGAAVNLGKDGTVKAIKAGTATITAETINGYKATCKITVKKAPTKVTLSPAKPELGVEQSGQMLVTFPSGQGGSYTFSSSDERVATIDAEGWVTAHEIGTTVITVRTYNNKTAKVTLTVSRGPDYITLNADNTLRYDAQLGGYVTSYSKRLAVGETFQLKAVVEYAAKGTISGYSSSNPAVASVSDSGLITALQPGTAAVTVRSSGGAEAMCTVTVGGSGTVAPVTTSLFFAQNSIIIKAGRETEAPRLKGLNLTAAKLNGAAYASSNAGIATIEKNASGTWVIRGVSEGTATVTATVDGVNASLSVRVVRADETPVGINFESDAVSMGLGETWKPRIYDDFGDLVEAQLVSDNEAIVAVGADGMLTAVDKGDTMIIAVYGDLVAMMTVSVRDAATAVQLDVSQITLGLGERRALNASGVGGAAAGFEYASSDESIVAVDATGMITAKGVGAAEISVSTAGSTMATCAVSVGSAPTQLSISPARVEANLGDGGVQLAYSFGASDEKGGVQFTSSNTSIATVSENGYVTYLKNGEVTITAETYNGMMASAYIAIGTASGGQTTASSVTYRLFTAAGYARPGYVGSASLPFPRNNANSVTKVLGNSRINGAEYIVNDALINPSKGAIFSGISNFFAGADDDDVSVVYLCSHGHMMGNYTGYRMSLPGYTKNGPSEYYMTSAEIFGAVSAIRGTVVLILDSCYSGTFIEDMRGALDAQGGRISVLTAASDTSATYYNVKDTNKAVDFFTFFLLQGLGYDERYGYYIKTADGSKGANPGLLLADTATSSGKKDGVITLYEFYNYAANCIAANIPSYSLNSWFWGSPNQRTRIYQGKNANLVIYMPK